jgi:hypothetical protein
MFHVNERHRLKYGQLKSDESYGNNGAFQIDQGNLKFVIIASDGGGWEHVSVHIAISGKQRTPTWDEMCYIKDVFWDEEDVVMQLHPAKSHYINNHKHTLHLWRPRGKGKYIPIPHDIMVGT